jgi:hypothetical protein
MAINARNDITSPLPHYIRFVDCNLQFLLFLKIIFFTMAAAAHKKADDGCLMPSFETVA